MEGVLVSEAPELVFWTCHWCLQLCGHLPAAQKVGWDTRSRSTPGKVTVPACPANQLGRLKQKQFSDLPNLSFPDVFAASWVVGITLRQYFFSLHWHQHPLPLDHLFLPYLVLSINCWHIYPRESRGAAYDKALFGLHIFLKQHVVLWYLEEIVNESNLLFFSLKILLLILFLTDKS